MNQLYIYMENEKIVKTEYKSIASEDLREVEELDRPEDETNFVENNSIGEIKINDRSKRTDSKPSN